MSYTDFDIPKVEKELGLKVLIKKIEWNLKPVPPSEWLLSSLEKGEKNAFVSEKARSEFIVTPILLESKENSNDEFQIFSGQSLNVDVNLGLTGECDFILSKTEPTPVLKAPIISLVEAKKNDIEIGLGQCIAQMFGAMIFNKKNENDFKVIFGCVTTGENWQFLRLENNIVIVDQERFYLSEIENVLGVFKSIFDFYKN
ncbi:MAG: hypothetical protein MUC29_11085 [Pyrinomonadaceae bacterium]|jgi:hypothetical protein|nr:hypothetical protein [Pyrinomonadaceae bacterium]